MARAPQGAHLGERAGGIAARRGYDVLARALATQLTKHECGGLERRDRDASHNLDAGIRMVFRGFNHTKTPMARFAPRVTTASLLALLAIAAPGPIGSSALAKYGSMTHCAGRPDADALHCASEV